MRSYLLLAIGLALASCATQKALPQYSEAEKTAQRESISYWQPDSTQATPKLSPVAQRKLEARRHRGQAPAPLVNDGGLRPLDSLVAVPYATPQPGRSPAFWQKLNPLRRRQPAVQPLAQKDNAVPQLPRKCKGCTFNTVAGNQTVAGKKATVAAGDKATASLVEKKAGPSVVASDSSVLNAVTGGGNLAAVHGDGNTLPQTTTTQAALGWKAELAKPAGAVLAGVLTVVLVGSCIYLIAAYKRRKLLENNG